MRLGKQPHLHDDRTLRMGAFLGDIDYPNTFDFDKGRVLFPVSSWGNDEWGCCVIVGRCEYQLRSERVESRRTVPITPSDVVDEYKRLSGAVSPGDLNDNGLVVLEAMREWRNDGWPFRRSSRGVPKQHRIAAYGELDAHDNDQLRAAIYLLHGVQLGFWLPLSARGQTNLGYWDVVDGPDPANRPGSWGGHLVFAKRYDADNIYVKTWGKEIRVTNAFVDRYCDEAWASVDSLDTKSRYLNVQGMINYLREIGARGIEG